MHLNEFFYAGFGVLLRIPADVQMYFEYIPFKSLYMMNEQTDSFRECLVVWREDKCCNIWSEKKKILLCTCQVSECLVKIIGLLPEVYAECTPYVLLHGSAVRKQNGNDVIFLGQNRIGKSTMLRYMVENKGARYVSDDIVYVDGDSLKIESNQYLPLLSRMRNERGVFEERYVIPSHNWIDKGRQGERKAIFVYLVCREEKTRIEKIQGYEKVILLFASLWRKDRKYMSVICDLASTMEMYRCCFDELSERIDIIYSLLEGKPDEEDY